MRLRLSRGRARFSYDCVVIMLCSKNIRSHLSDKILNNIVALPVRDSISSLCNGLNLRRVLVRTGDVIQALVSIVAPETRRTTKNEESELSSSSFS